MAAAAARIGVLAAALLRAWLAARLCAWLGTPLPWMIGPLFATAAACMAGLPLQAPVQLRYGGQWAIGTTLGLYFTAPVMATLVSFAGAIVLAVLFALALGVAAARLLQRLSGADGATCFFAMAVGGAAEMAAQGERHGAAVDQVAAAHSLRMLMVVASVPFAIGWWSRHGMARGAALAAPALAATADAVQPGGLLLLMALTALGALALMRRAVPNAWVIGPLGVALLLTACGVHLSRLPESMVHLGQLFVGVALGGRFTRRFVHAAPRFMGSAAICALFMLLAAAAFGVALAALAGLAPAVAILATSPGGIAEMALTARMLELGVPVVTAFHVTRMTAVVLLIGPLYRRMMV